MAAYSLAQVVIDFESGYYMLHKEPPIHRQLHTFLMGGLIGLLCGLLVARFGAWLSRPRDVVGEPLAAEYRLSIAVMSGVFGGLLHPVLDGIIYSDIRPFRPFSSANPLYGLVSARFVYEFCVAAALVGAALLLAWERRPRRL
jgi:membrane-bound metal-dependent hydrolase YbcI (DUF457 family)